MVVTAHAQQGTVLDQTVEHVTRVSKFICKLKLHQNSKIDDRLRLLNEDSEISVAGKVEN